MSLARGRTDELIDEAAKGRSTGRGRESEEAARLNRERMFWVPRGFLLYLLQFARQLRSVDVGGSEEETEQLVGVRVV